MQMSQSGTKTSCVVTKYVILIGSIDTVTMLSKHMNSYNIGVMQNQA